MDREIELKLEITPERAEELKAHPLLRDAEHQTQWQVTTYYDTADSTLRKNGFSLRLREANGKFTQTAKSLSNGAGLFARSEWEDEIDGPTLDLGRLAHTPLPGLSSDDLHPVVVSELARTAYSVKFNKSAIEVDLDEGSIAAGGRELPACELELELVSGEPAELMDFAHRLAVEADAKIAVLSKAERGFALSDGGLDKVSKASLVPVQPDMTVAEGFETIVGSCLKHFRLNEPVVIASRNKEALHQCRVAIRRLRSALTLFRKAIEDERLPFFRDELRWWSGAFAKARNLDVYLQRELPNSARHALQEQRRAAYEQVIEALNSERASRLMLEMVGWAAAGQWREARVANGGFERFASRGISRLWKKISHARHLVAMSEKRRHRLRIRVKKLRYSLDFIEALHPHPSRRQKKFEAALHDLQETLGFLNDIVEARAFAEESRWLITPQDDEEREQELLRDASRVLRQLRKIGPYWNQPG